jgi:hypothetical protein
MGKKDGEEKMGTERVDVLGLGCSPDFFVPGAKAKAQKLELERGKGI